MMSSEECADYRPYFFRRMAPVALRESESWRLCGIVIQHIRQQRGRQPSPVRFGVRDLSAPTRPGSDNPRYLLLHDTSIPGR
jgi:hypothetical protein